MELLAPLILRKIRKKKKKKNSLEVGKGKFRACNLRKGGECKDK